MEYGLCERKDLYDIKRREGRSGSKAIIGISRDFNHCPTPGWEKDSAAKNTV